MPNKCKNLKDTKSSCLSICTSGLYDNEGRDFLHYYMWFGPLLFEFYHMIYIPYPRVNCLKIIRFTATHTHIAHIWQYPPPGVAVGGAMAGSAGSVGWELLAKIFRTSVPGSRGVWVMISWSAKGPGGGGDSAYERGGDTRRLA